MLTVTKIFRFEAAHHLPHYKGPCNNLHGHSYKLEVTVSGNVCRDEMNEKCGMIMDFKDLKTVVKSVVDKYDHCNLNDYFENPTAEIMVTDIGEEILSRLPFNVNLSSVKLWETDSSYAEYKPVYYPSHGRCLKSAT